jgi:hypothetical protein
MIDYNKHKAHPTMYKGVQFRSRLEATWAALFDLRGWDGKRDDERNGPYITSWEYEPMDLDGWTPDFIIRTDSLIANDEDIPILVEVKPATRCEEFIDTSAFKYLLKHPCVVVFAGLSPDYVWTYDLPNGPFIHHEADKFGKNQTSLWKKAKNLTQWRPQ